MEFTYRKNTVINGTLIEENDEYYIVAIENGEDTISLEKEVTTVKEAVVEVEDHKYYLAKVRRRNRETMEISEIHPESRSTNKLAEFLLERKGWKTYSEVKENNNGEYGGQWFWRSLKGSIIKELQAEASKLVEFVVYQDSSWGAEA